MDHQNRRFKTGSEAPAKREGVGSAVGPFTRPETDVTLGPHGRESSQTPGTAKRRNAAPQAPSTDENTITTIT